MPYIKSKDRALVPLFGPRNAGELNYEITLLCKEYLAFMGKNYQHLNEVVGVLECAKQEFYRRVVAPYEDEKIKENGDVY